MWLHWQLKFLKLIFWAFISPSFSCLSSCFSQELILSYVFFRMSSFVCLLTTQKSATCSFVETGERGGSRVLARAGSKLVTDYLMLSLFAWLQQSLGTDRDGLSGSQDLWVDQAMSMGERAHVRYLLLATHANTVYERQVEIEGDTLFNFFLPTSSRVTRLMAVWKHLTSYLSFI